jgi:pilus assembly protein CpaB
VNDVLGVAGFVLPGDRVDVMLTRSNVVDVLLQGVKVLAIDQIADQRQDNPSVVRTVTFEVSTLEAQKLVLGGTVGTLSLALRNVASTDIERNERVTINDLNELDVAEDILKANAAKQAAEPDPTLTRIEGIEQMVRELSTGVSEKLEGVEAKLEKEPVIQEVVVEKIVQVAPPVPVRSTVGVIRNGQRNEYKVDKSEEDGGAEEASLDQEIEVQVSQ